MEIAGPIEPGLVGERIRLDDERVAFPAAARVAQKLPDAGRQVRPLAVGTMIVAAFYTLYKLRTSLIQGIGRAFGDLGAAQAEGAGRQDIDIDFRKTGLAIAVLAVPLFGLYWYFSESFGGAILLTIMMVILGFLFAAVAGYLVGLLGSSNNPISGLTLSTWLCQLKRCTPEAPRS